MSARKRRTYEPKYPYTLLAEALDIFRNEPFHDDEARNKFLAHVQPLVRCCVHRVASEYGGGVLRSEDDICGFVNVKLLESWLPRYLASEKKVERILEAVKYFSKSVRGYVLTFVRDTYDSRVVPCGELERRGNPFTPNFEDRYLRQEIDEAIERVLQQHLALRKRPELVTEESRKLADYQVWKEFRETGGLPS